jgi:hypothetical protein
VSRVAVLIVAERGTVTRALLNFKPGQVDDRGLAGRICHACVDGLDIDGAAISLLTASVSRETLWATDPIAELLEDLQFTLNEGACMQAAGSRSVGGSPPLQSMSFVPPCCFGMHFPSATGLQRQRNDRCNAEDC